MTDDLFVYVKLDPLIESKIVELKASRDASHAIVMRVYRECGPAKLFHDGDSRHPYWQCKACENTHYNPVALASDHQPDCLWKSAETLLTKEGLI
jgi:hypothetical protein